MWKCSNKRGCSKIIFLTFEQYRMQPEGLSPRYLGFWCFQHIFIEFPHVEVYIINRNHFFFLVIVVVEDLLIPVFLVFVVDILVIIECWSDHAHHVILLNFIHSWVGVMIVAVLIVIMTIVACSVSVLFCLKRVK